MESNTRIKRALRTYLNFDPQEGTLKKVSYLVGHLCFIPREETESEIYSFDLILVCRAILGLSIGIISPTLNSLIAENLQGEARARMNGIQTSINASAALCSCLSVDSLPRQGGETSS